MSLTTQEFRELNDAQRGKLADRETRYLTSDQAQALVDRATALLESSEWSDVAAGLAVLIGRRISEILLSRFSFKSPWSITFSEMAKKADTAGLTIEIPTLAPAQTVLKAVTKCGVSRIAKLQTGLNIEDLKLNSLSPKMAKQVVNQRGVRVCGGSMCGTFSRSCSGQKRSRSVALAVSRNSLYSRFSRLLCDSSGSLVLPSPHP